MALSLLAVYPDISPPHTRSPSRLGFLEPIRRTVHPTPPAMQHMGVLHRCIDVFVPKPFLDRANVIASFQQVRRKRMAKSVAPRVLGEPSFAASFFDRLLQDGLMKMVPAGQARAGVRGKLCGRKHKLPPPFFCCIGVLLF